MALKEGGEPGSGAGNVQSGGCETKQVMQGRIDGWGLLMLNGVRLLRPGGVAGETIQIDTSHLYT